MDKEVLQRLIAQENLPKHQTKVFTKGGGKRVLLDFVLLAQAIQMANTDGS
jgi:hypothetical protein